MAAYHAGELQTARDLLTRATSTGSASDTALLFIDRLQRLDAAAGLDRPAAVLGAGTTSTQVSPVRAERRWAITVVVNNAGIAVTKPILDQTEDDWRQVVGVNLDGAWRVAQAAARHMVQHAQGGSIVNVASILGLRVTAQVPAYAASKAALVQLTKAMALELARHRIRVNALAPGYIETSINRDFFASEAGQALIKRIPQRRIGTPQDLDGPLLLLASDAGAYMTGAIVAVDGGHLVSSL